MESGGDAAAELLRPKQAEASRHAVHTHMTRMFVGETSS